MPLLSSVRTRSHVGSLVVAVMASATCLVGCHPTPRPVQPAQPERLRVDVLAEYPFDPGSFTQGLEMGPDGTVLVGTGQYGSSEIYRRTVGGEVLDAQPLPSRFFGEGLTRHGDTIWQLTWRSGTALGRDARSLDVVGSARYDGEGWGLCSRGAPGSTAAELVMSDGTDTLQVRDPETFAVRDEVAVRLAGAPVTGLNELECVGDDVYANVFLTSEILRIDRASGNVEAVIDASELTARAHAHPATPDHVDAVLNGIAAVGPDRFLLAGKWWPMMFEVRFVEA
ncbi:glutaminyl-peptide cyclotransferase [Corynebacterium uterequi]|uniref:Glutamine cyclotransferase n=1 Tax=Corynebacterium uterequi TaxID=1072256 RepID=A0A0G3HD88_9CORY|nr:glutaminyl-peptide cyclotransferase [Corynebacterium uterequi]AKK10645.1 glutamine cyclotransferase [Corynebacterium uterequi]